MSPMSGTTSRLAVLATAFCACSLAVAPVAVAATDPRPSPTQSPLPDPPAGMSSLGGDRLAQPGVQVDPQADAPALPDLDNAYSFVVADADTGEILAARNPHWQLAPASTLKMLFADTVMPKLDPSTQHQVTSADLASVDSDASRVGIKENDTYKVDDLWRGVFLRSGNDAVHVLCNMNGGIPATVQEMQAEAQYLQADDTHVVTPDGYDAPGQVSSAYDLALFARAGMANPQFRSYAGTKTADFPGDPGTTFQIQNTNRLLGVYPGMIGVKNGYTTNAENTFVGMATHGNQTLLVSIMHVVTDTHGQTIYDDTRKLLDWGFAAAGKVNPVGTLVGPAPGSSAPPSGGLTPGGKTVQTAAGSHVAASTSSGGSWTTYAEVGVPVALLVGGLVLVVRRRAAHVAGGPGLDDDIVH